MLDTSKIDLAGAPGFDPANYPDISGADWDMSYRDFWAKITS